MRCKKDNQFQKLTTKQADFFRLWEKKKGENGGVNPTFAEMQVNGYSKAMCAVYLKILRSRDFLPKTIRCYPPQKDAEFPDIGKRTADTLRAIRQLTAEQGIPPSFREIAKTTKTTHNAVNDNVNRLIQSGYLEKVGDGAGFSRSLRLTEKAFTPSRKTMEAEACERARAGDAAAKIIADLREEVRVLQNALDEEHKQNEDLSRWLRDAQQRANELDKQVNNRQNVIDDLREQIAEELNQEPPARQRSTPP